MHPQRQKSPQLQVKDVERRWGERVALSGVNLILNPGERVAFIGPSGSGKSTLLRLLSGALSPSRGRVFVNHRDMNTMSQAQLRAYRSACGIVEQELGLVPQLSVHRNVLAGMVSRWSNMRVMFSLLWPLEATRVAAMLDEVGLADRQWDATYTLSGGQKQRVAIARALIHEPGILFADEPTSSLDPTTARSVVELLLEESARYGISLMLSTHWVSVVCDHVDRIVGLRNGEVVLDRRASEVKDSMLDALYAGSLERH